MTGHLGSAIRSVSAAIRIAPRPFKHIGGEQPVVPPPFVTISREGGAGGRTLGQMLVSRLNEMDPGEVPWTLWDRELVEKVASDHNVAKEVVEALGEGGRSWIEEFLEGLVADRGEARVYGLVAATIRALARHGRVVIIGRGGVYITRNMPAGVHLRLVAPLQHRAQHMAQQMNLSIEAATAQVNEIDRQRAAFYRRFWPRELLSGDVFTLTINTAGVPEARAAECVIPVILPNTQAAHRSDVSEPEMAGR